MSPSINRAWLMRNGERPRRRNVNRIKTAMAAMAMGIALGGCASLDQISLGQVMGGISQTLDTTGDVLSGDFRSIASATPVTLNQIWTDWKKNEVTASKKYLRTQLSIPGIVISVSKTSSSVVREQQFSVIFRDPTNKQCRGVAYTRDALMVQEKKVSNLGAGDRIRITGVMQDQLGSVVSADASSCFFSFAKATFQPDAGSKQAAK